ncbi:hypothetical protein [Pandoravirus japonicus]|uniref:Uncharacterized protein n=1 Tax=Pandoravirus japonicus TaxID=2823154 RepID=A0A811BQM5_9VIRU|nr:hypothetical protein [Pandoravirus japonicus]
MSPVIDGGWRGRGGARSHRPSPSAVPLSWGAARAGHPPRIVDASLAAELVLASVIAQGLASISPSRPDMYFGANPLAVVVVVVAGSPLFSSSRSLFFFFFFIPFLVSLRARAWRPVRGSARFSPSSSVRSTRPGSARVLESHARRDARSCADWPFFFFFRPLARARPSPFLCGCINFFFPHLLPSGTDLAGAALCALSGPYPFLLSSAPPLRLRPPPRSFFPPSFGRALFFLHVFFVVAWLREPCARARGSLGDNNTQAPKKK